MNDKKVVKPMDDGIREQAVGVPNANNRRVCYAIKTLVAEVLELFPETPVEYSNYDGRNTALDVTFDLTVLNADDRETLSTLLQLLGDRAYSEDQRIREVTYDDSAVLVSIISGPRTQDIREPFGLADAYVVLAEDDEEAIIGAPFYGGGDGSHLYGGSL